MLIAHAFETISGNRYGIEIANPAMVARVRRMADTMNPYEIAAALGQAVTDAADAQHLRSFEEAQFGEAGADAIVDAEYHEELADAWSLVATEHQLYGLEELCAVH